MWVHCPRASNGLLPRRSNLVGYVRWDAQSDRFPPCQTIISTAFRSQSGLPTIQALSRVKSKPNSEYVRFYKMLPYSQINSIARKCARGAIIHAWEHGRRAMLRARIFAFCILILAAGTGTAQDHEHAMGVERLGTVHFATSCNGVAQKQFDRAVALMHSFQFSEAIDGFNAVLRDDHSCVIAYWGISLSQWSNPFAAGLKATSQLQDGRHAAEQG